MANLVTHPAIRDALRLLERDSMRFGDDVREQRLRIGASLRDVARVAGVSPAMVWRVERGDPAIGPESRAAIARAVGGTARTAFYVDATPLIHDAAHSRIVERVVALAAPGWRVRVELVVPGGHGRSVDVALDDRAQLVLLEIESKVRRWEERLRMLEDKRAAFMRAGESRPIFVALVLPPTRHHQALVRRLPATTASALPAEPRLLRAALEEGGPWPGDGILWVASGPNRVERALGVSPPETDPANRPIVTPGCRTR